MADYLVGDARVDAAELARVELTHCAAQVASLMFDACGAFESLRADAPAPERAYADYLAGRVSVADATLLPERTGRLRPTPQRSPASPIRWRA
jgi:hypothetical protein